MRAWVILWAVAALTTSPTVGHADWFTILDEKEQLDVFAVASDAEGVMSAVHLRCHGRTLKITVESRQSGEDAREYTQTNLKIGDEASTEVLIMSAIPIVTPSKVIAFEATLSENDSKRLLQSLANGNRLDISILNAALIHDQYPKYVPASGAIFAAVAIMERCGIS